MSTYTITFGDVAENHVNMQKIGKLHDNGYSTKQLKDLSTKLIDEGFNCQYISLDKNEQEIECGVLVIREAVQKILGSTSEIFKEHERLDMDKKALMYGRVVNKIARWNLCFDEIAQEPEYSKGMGRIVAFKDVPLTNLIRTTISEWLEETSPLKAEANYYYDITKCGISYHGDSERRKVVAIRLGSSMPLHFQWYHDLVCIGENYKIYLNDGDIYIMSEKAVGNDWKKRKIFTLRHATGSNNFTKI